MILRGIAKLARGNKTGFAEFGTTAEAFSASLAPLIAFPLVGAVITAVTGDWKMALLGFVSQLCMVLVIPVLTYEFSRLLGQQSLWLRTAIAQNWCYWLVLPASFVAILVGSLVVPLGVGAQASLLGALGVAGLYLLWNRWFIFKAGLDIHGGWAALIVLATIICSGLFMLLPLLVGMPLPGMNGVALP